jgi:hypothetical protein
MEAVTCVVTGEKREAKPTKKGNLRLPRGWRRLPDGRPCSPDGWSQLYALQVLHVVLRPADGQWKPFRELLRGAWTESRALAQWALDQCFQGDVRRTPDSPDRMPKPKPIYLYGLAKENYPRWSQWEGAAASANCTLRRAEKKWRETRRAVLWYGSDRPPIYGYPQPYILDADQWDVVAPDEDDKQEWKASLALPGGRILCTLRQGKRAGRAHNRKRLDTHVLKALAAKEAVKVEAAVIRRLVNGSDHRTGSAQSNGQGVRVTYEECLKIVCYIRKRARKHENAKTLWVVTQPDCLLSVLDEDKDRLWNLNADYVRKWIVGYSRRLQRLSEDAKAERRRPRDKKMPLAQDRQQLKLKQDLRMKSALHELSRQVVNYVLRARATKVEYKDQEKRYIESFPWFVFRESYLVPKLKAEGIEFVHTNKAQETHASQVVHRSQRA